MFIGLGSAWTVMATSYTIGKASAMGPGFFPLVLAVLLAVIGLIAVIQAVLASTDDPVRLRPLWPCATVTAAVVAFGLLVNTAGLVPAVLGLVAISGVHRLRSHVLELLIIAAILAAGATLLFIHGLQLPFVAVQLGND